MLPRCGMKNAFITESDVILKFSGVFTGKVISLTVAMFSSG
jgi:hypothetical protein